MSVNTILGQAARGEKFFPRNQVIEEINKKLKSGSNLLMVAPRRVGKTSILYYLIDNPQPDFDFVYYISESVNNENEFYRKLFNHIVDTLTTARKYSHSLLRFIKEQAVRVEKIGTDGLTLGQNQINYFDHVTHFLKGLNIEGRSIIVLVDEFAQTVENIIRDEGISQAIHFLQTNRVIRQNPDFINKIRFIYAGSIGLENVVDRINANQEINDLLSIRVLPLTKNESAELVTKILSDSNLEISSSTLNYLIEQIEWLIPFYFHLIIDEVEKIIVRNDLGKNTITKAIIDEAIANSIEMRNCFEPWLSRLRNAYAGPEFNFIKDVLNHVAELSTITSAEIYDIAVKNSIEVSYRNLVHALIHDGYINDITDSKEYRFNSPILRMWWRIYVAE